MGGRRLIPARVWAGEEWAGGCGRVGGTMAEPQVGSMQPPGRGRMRPLRLCPCVVEQREPRSSTHGGCGAALFGLLRAIDYLCQLTPPSR